MRERCWKLTGITLLALAFVFGGSLALTDTAGAANPCAAQKANPCNPCAAKGNPCNPCAAQKANPCNPCAAKNPCAANPCNPCAAGGGGGAKAEARMIIGKVIYAKADHVAVDWNGKKLNIGLSKKTQYRQGPTSTSAESIKPGQRIIVSMLDRGGKLSANYVYLSKAGKGGNPCNPCAANPCNPCAAQKAANPCNPCAAKKGNPCNPCAAKKAANPCNPCADKKANPCNPCAAKKK